MLTQPGRQACVPVPSCHRLPFQCKWHVGIKPTLGLVSRSEIVPIAHSQDTAGPMARTVADATAILSVLVGPDPTDTITKASIVESHPDYTSFCTGGDLAGIRLGVARNDTGFTSGQIFC